MERESARSAWRDRAQILCGIAAENPRSARRDGPAKSGGRRCAGRGEIFGDRANTGIDPCFHLCCGFAVGSIAGARHCWHFRSSTSTSPNVLAMGPAPAE